MNERIKELYYDPQQPWSLSGLETFYKALRKNRIFVDKEQLRQWLLSQDPYTLHYPKIQA